VNVVCVPLRSGFFSSTFASLLSRCTSSAPANESKHVWIRMPLFDYAYSVHAYASAATERVVRLHR
jgi:hypothetical protein